MSKWHNVKLANYKYNNGGIKMRYNGRPRDKLRKIFNSGGISNDEFICAICGNQPIDKHHENYDIWYSFIPLCKKCHGLTRGGIGKQRKLKRLVEQQE